MSTSKPVLSCHIIALRASSCEAQGRQRSCGAQPNSLPEWYYKREKPILRCFLVFAALDDHQILSNGELSESRNSNLTGIKSLSDRRCLCLGSRSLPGTAEQLFADAQELARFGRELDVSGSCIGNTGPHARARGRSAKARRRRKA